MGAETAISVDGVSKKYCKSLRRTMFYGVRDLAADLVQARRNSDRLRPGEFWALEDVSLELRRGEWMGLVGPNGAGKSTLLKLLNGIIRPDTGRIEIRGKLRGLIELGAGFHPLLSGRENIYVQGAIMGMTRREIDEKFDEIVDFAGIGDFLDAPVKFYSSGMHARLGFSIAIAFDPDVLVIDEVLAVGDIGFQEKCMRRMERMRDKDKAVLMVQQHTYWIEALCDRAVWLDRGHCVGAGTASEVVSAYLDDQDRRLAESVRAVGGGVAAAPPPPASLDSVELLGEDDVAKDVFRPGERMTVRIRYTAHERIEAPLFNIRIFNRGYGVLEASMLIDGPVVDSIEGTGTVECRLDRLPLTPKVYELVVFARAKEGVSDILPMRTYAVFRVSEENAEGWPMKGPMAINHLRQGSPVYVRRSWHFENGHRTPPH
jgi:lipopolysaccharide transport system ATP-binding protein